LCFISKLSGRKHFKKDYRWLTILKIYCDLLNVVFLFSPNEKKRKMLKSP